MHELTTAGERIVLLAGRARGRSPCHLRAGHLHPALRIAADGHPVRLPCFAFGPAVGPPPACRAFAGHMNIEPDPDMRGFVATPDRAFEVPHAATRRRRKA